MKNKAKRIELRTPDGKVILVLHLYEKEMALKDDPTASADQGRETGKAKPQSSDSQKENPPMTDAQKRYLFRLSADQGIEGDKAHEHLKELFRVDSLKEVTKLEAGKMIERLIEEAKGAEDGPPF